MIAAVGWQLFFFMTGLLPLVWLLPWLLFMRRWESAHTSASDAGGGAQPHTMSWRESFALLKQRSLLGICLGYGCYNYCWIVMLTWLPGYLKLERGFNARELAVFSSVPYVIGFFVALAAGVMSDWFVRRGVAELRVRKAFMLSGMAVACLIIPAGIVADKLTAVGLLAAALCGLSASGVNSWLVTQAVCDKQIVGTATGLQNFFGNLSGIVAPALTGLIAQTTGSFALALGLTGALLMAGIVFYWLMVAEKVTTASAPFDGD